jgi:hypothetical protein
MEGNRDRAALLPPHSSVSILGVWVIKQHDLPNGVTRVNGAALTRDFEPIAQIFDASRVTTSGLRVMRPVFRGW